MRTNFYCGLILLLMGTGLSSETKTGFSFDINYTLLEPSLQRVSLYGVIKPTDKLLLEGGLLTFSIAHDKVNNKVHYSTNPLFSLASAIGILLGDAGSGEAGFYGLIFLSANMITNSKIHYEVWPDQLYLYLGHNMDFYLFGDSPNAYFDTKFGLNYNLFRYFGWEKNSISLQLEVMKPWLKAYYPDKRFQYGANFSLKLF